MNKFLLLFIPIFFMNTSKNCESHKENYPLTPSGIFIKTDISKYDYDEIFKHFFGANYEKNDNWFNGFDTRDEKSIRITFHEQGIIITNFHFTQKVLVNGNKELIEKIYNYFDQPDLIYSYMHYDSGDSFGFRLIQKGKTTRYRFSLSSDWVTKDFGNPIEAELEILNSKLYYETERKEFLIYKLENEKTPRNYHFINSHLASVVMEHFFGFNFHQYIEAENYYFTRKE
ncbi:hypothetical protein [Winogradskyella sediminis]|uniref:Uncharacterized protein n=1 Tax=Winogradskyella sediminis TaxID=1382466 RepID=A0A1H1NEA7_9FLAO|nr:hypothetical protein [Winogradskyella sediminis]SDR97257.1 hypothetical protein SAMN04489797_0578 [Winogradskyella sediminis]